MKKLIFLLCFPLIIWSCGTANYAQYDISNLRTGMSKAQVRNIIGSPERYLISTMTPYGYQEVLQYRTSYSDLYALEFLNDYLMYAEYMYDGHYVPYYHQTHVPPTYGTVIFPPNYRPGPPPSPGRPGNNNRPDDQIVNPRPPAREREPANNNNNNVRPPANNNSSNSSRPSVNDNNSSNSSRPAARPRSSVNDTRDSSSGSDNNTRSRETNRR